jgi:GTP-binding protein HflX
LPEGALEPVEARAAAARDGEDDPDAFAISAAKGDGFAALLSAIDTALARFRETRRTEIPAEDGAALAWLHRFGDVLEHETDEASGVQTVIASLDPGDWDRYAQRFGYPATALE